MENKDEKGRSFLDQIEGSRKVDPEQLAEFRKAMIEDVIPEIVKVVEDRQLRAAETRQRKLKS